MFQISPRFDSMKINGYDTSDFMLFYSEEFYWITLEAT